MRTTPLPLVAVFALGCVVGTPKDSTDAEPPMVPTDTSTDFEPPMDYTPPMTTPPMEPPTGDTGTTDSGSHTPPMATPTDTAGGSGTVVAPMPYPTGGSGSTARIGLSPLPPGTPEDR